jgi:PAS domain S-box-containing protein
VTAEKRNRPDTDTSKRETARETPSLRERAIDEAPVGIIFTDPGLSDNPITYVNRGFVRLTGYSEAEIIGQNCRFLQGERTAREPVERLRNAIDAGKPAPSSC